MFYFMEDFGIANYADYSTSFSAKLNHKSVIEELEISYSNKINHSGKKRDYDQIFDTTMFNKSLRFALITRAFSKLL